MKRVIVDGPNCITSFDADNFEIGTDGILRIAKDRKIIAAYAAGLWYDVKITEQQDA